MDKESTYHNYDRSVYGNGKKRPFYSSQNEKKRDSTTYRENDPQDIRRMRASFVQRGDNVGQICSNAQQFIEVFCH